MKYLLCKRDNLALCTTTNNLNDFKQNIQVIQRKQVYFSSSNVSTDTTVIVKDEMLNEKFTFCYKITIKWKRIKGDHDSAIKEHLSFCNHTPDFEDFSILATNHDNFKVTLMKSLLINIDHSPLNKNRQSLTLELFDS